MPNLGLFTGNCFQIDEGVKKQLNDRGKGHWGVTYSLHSSMENYLHLGGTTHKVDTLCVEKFQNANIKTYHTRSHVQERELTFANYFSNFIKVISYFTFILPAIAYIARTALRIGLLKEVKEDLEPAVKELKKDIRDFLQKNPGVEYDDFSNFIESRLGVENLGSVSQEKKLVIFNAIKSSPEFSKAFIQDFYEDFYFVDNQPVQDVIKTITQELKDDIRTFLDTKPTYTELTEHLKERGVRYTQKEIVAIFEVLKEKSSPLMEEFIKEHYNSLAFIQDKEIQGVVEKTATTLSENITQFLSQNRWVTRQGFIDFLANERPQGRNFSEKEMIVILNALKESNPKLMTEFVMEDPHTLSFLQKNALEEVVNSFDKGMLSKKGWLIDKMLLQLLALDINEQCILDMVKKLDKSILTQLAHGEGCPNYLRACLSVKPPKKTVFRELVKSFRHAPTNSQIFIELLYKEPLQVDALSILAENMAWRDNEDLALAIRQSELETLEQIAPMITKHCPENLLHQYASIETVPTFIEFIEPKKTALLESLILKLEASHQGKVRQRVAELKNPGRKKGLAMALRSPHYGETYRAVESLNLQEDNVIARCPTDTSAQFSRVLQCKDITLDVTEKKLREAIESGNLGACEYCLHHLPVVTDEILELALEHTTPEKNFYKACLRKYNDKVKLTSAAIRDNLVIQFEQAQKELEDLLTIRSLDLESIGLPLQAAKGKFKSTFYQNQIETAHRDTQIEYQRNPKQDFNQLFRKHIGVKIKTDTRSLGTKKIFVLSNKNLPPNFQKIVPKVQRIAEGGFSSFEVIHAFEVTEDRGIEIEKVGLKTLKDRGQAWARAERLKFNAITRQFKGKSLPHVEKLGRLGNRNVVELYEGGDAKHLAATVTKKDRIQIMRDVLRGMKELKELGYYQLDMKPANIFWRKNQAGEIEAIIGDLDGFCYIPKEMPVHFLQDIQEHMGLEIPAVITTRGYAKKTENIFEKLRHPENIDLPKLQIEAQKEALHQLRITAREIFRGFRDHEIDALINKSLAPGTTIEEALYFWDNFTHIYSQNP